MKSSPLVPISRNFTGWEQSDTCILMALVLTFITIYFLVCYVLLSRSSRYSFVRECYKQIVIQIVFCRTIAYRNIDAHSAFMRMFGWPSATILAPYTLLQHSFCIFYLAAYIRTRLWYSPSNLMCLELCLRPVQPPTLG